MLAAQCVCALLNAEHEVVRQAIAAVSEIVQLDAADGENLPEQERLKALVSFIEAFEHRHHLPKERNYLFPALRGRSPRADQVLREIEQAQRRDAELLSRALTVLLEADSPSAVGADHVKALLRQYCSATQERMAREEGTLFMLAQQLLDEDEWPRIASAMSDLPAFAQPVHMLERDTSMSVPMPFSPMGAERRPASAALHEPRFM